LALRPSDLVDRRRANHVATEKNAVRQAERRRRAYIRLAITEPGRVRPMLTGSSPGRTDKLGASAFARK